MQKKGVDNEYQHFKSIFDDSTKNTMVSSEQHRQTGQRGSFLDGNQNISSFADGDGMMGRSQRKLMQSGKRSMKLYGTSTAKSKQDVEQRMTDTSRGSIYEMRMDQHSGFGSML